MSSRTPRPLLPALGCFALVLAAACSTTEPAAPDAKAAAQGEVRAIPPPPPKPAAAQPARDEVEKDQGQAQQIVSNGPVAMPEPAPASALMSKQKKEAVAVQGMLMAPAAPALYNAMPEQNRENYGHYESNPVQRVAESPVSTFSIDVDTGSYSNVRRLLNAGSLPPADAVRVEELVNYFDYAYAPPRDTNTPFAVHTEIAPTPWNPKTLLLQVGIQGWKPQGQLPPSNLVFLVDVSGSMLEPDKLPLVKSSLKLLAHQMSHQDSISLVVYAGNTGLVLPPTPGDQTAKIDAALDQLEAGGSTNGAAGIQLAYQVAQQAFIKGGNNRVMLATDGDFNVGTVSFDALLDLIKDKRKSGIALTTLGVGAGNYNDRLMEQLADAGDGNYAYLDSLKEAQKVLVEQRAATLLTIARDVKIQVEFNPARVSEYRLIGYEDRLLKREDFSNDKVDAGDIGAGHRVTALYEIALVGSGGERVEPLRYGEVAVPDIRARIDELGYVRLRYKRPEDGVNAASRLIQQPLPTNSIESADKTSPAFRLAAAVAGYGQLLRGGTYLDNGGRHFGYADVATLARSAGGDPQGTVGEFIQLAQLAGALETRQAAASNNMAVVQKE